MAGIFSIAPVQCLIYRRLCFLEQRPEGSFPKKTLNPVSPVKDPDRNFLGTFPHRSEREINAAMDYFVRYHSSMDNLEKLMSDRI